MKTTATLLVDEPAPQVRRFTLNRAERMNALDGPTLLTLNHVVREAAEAGDAVHVVVIRGIGRAFCAGNDLKWLARGVLSDRAAHQQHQDLMQDTFERLEAAPQIVMVSVNGFALAGGFELALACDLIVIDEEAELGDEHFRCNLLPSGGSTQRVPRKIGLQRPLYHLVTGRRMTGQLAVDMGMAALAVSVSAREAETVALARSIAPIDGQALAATKAMVRRALELPLRDCLAYERWMQHRYRTLSPALEAGVNAFATDHG
jgi:enoyl-CoA hydratase